MGKLGYKFTKEQRKKVSLGLLGKKKSKQHNINVGLSNKGKKRTDEQKRKQSERMTGKKLSKKTRENMSLARKGKKLSEEHKMNLSLSKKGIPKPNLRGEKSGLWKGGITPLTKLIRSSFQNRQWISDVFHRDDFTCQECGKRGGDLNVHHIKLFSIIWEENNIKTRNQAIKCDELWNINNGITLCEKCHKDIQNQTVTAPQDVAKEQTVIHDVAEEDPGF